MLQRGNADCAISVHMRRAKPVSRQELAAGSLDIVSFPLGNLLRKQQSNSPGNAYGISFKVTRAWFCIVEAKCRQGKDQFSAATIGGVAASIERPCAVRLLVCCMSPINVVHLVGPADTLCCWRCCADRVVRVDGANVAGARGRDRPGVHLAGGAGPEQAGAAARQGARVPDRVRGRRAHRACRWRVLPHHGGCRAAPCNFLHLAIMQIPGATCTAGFLALL